jgi:LPS sulfotransferase NodH
MFICLVVLFLLLFGSIDATTKFILVSEPRSSSTLLLNLLTQDSRFAMATELFDRNALSLASNMSWQLSDFSRTEAPSSRTASILLQAFYSLDDEIIARAKLAWNRDDDRRVLSNADLVRDFNLAREFMARLVCTHKHKGAFDGAEAIGFKLFGRQVSATGGSGSARRLMRWLDARNGALGGVKVVYLYRQDAVGGVLSLIEANGLGAWHRMNNDDAWLGAQRRLTFGSAEMATLRALVPKRCVAIESFLELAASSDDVDILPVAYSEVVGDDSLHALHRISRFLIGSPYKGHAKAYMARGRSSLSVEQRFGDEWSRLNATLGELHTAMCRSSSKSATCCQHWLESM